MKIKIEVLATAGLLIGVALLAHRTPKNEMKVPPMVEMIKPLNAAGGAAKPMIGEPVHVSPQDAAADALLTPLSVQINDLQAQMDHDDVVSRINDAATSSSERKRLMDEVGRLADMKLMLVQRQIALLETRIQQMHHRSQN